ncbi:Quinol monooxygenase YgiN [Bradyrhizobium erythrophlei]|jgi:quinol monooxygenase YgiN|nr:Quinol monooxygenase YgiN [Bradyrhizobium erythrophlei]
MAASNQNLVVTAFWEANPGEEGAIADLLKDFLPQAQQEPGVKQFQIHQNISKPREFFFYEVFAGEAAFADHQQTAHFKNIIAGQAVPRLAKRERSQFRFI